MIHAVRITLDKIIDNWLVFADASALSAANAISAPFVWIGQPDWAVGMDATLAAISNVWDGHIPATFALPATGPLPATLAVAKAIVDQRQADLDTATAALRIAIDNQQALIPVV